MVLDHLLAAAVSKCMHSVTAAKKHREKGKRAKRASFEPQYKNAAHQARLPLLFNILAITKAPSYVTQDMIDQVRLATAHIASMSLDNVKALRTSIHHASFLGIPTELRLVIYDLAITPSLVEHMVYSGKRINIADSRPPNKSLLLACRQTFHEARKVYQQKYRNYWSSHEFCLRNRAEDLKTVLTYDDKSLDSITFLEIVEWYLCEESMEMNMIKQRRGWYWYCPTQGGSECVFGYIEKDSDGTYVWNNLERHDAEQPDRAEIADLQEHGLPQQRDVTMRIHLEALRISQEMFCPETLLPKKSQRMLEDEGEEEEERRHQEDEEPDEAERIGDMPGPIISRW